MGDEANNAMPRKAMGVDGVEREWKPSELYSLYVRGFRDGASITAMRHSGYPPYDRGYQDGIAARNRAAAEYAREVGHVPSVLRTQGEP